MSDGMVQLVELLSVAKARIDLDCPEKRPVVVLIVRNQPDRSWTFRNLGLTIPQAERLRDDLIDLLKAPASFLLLAVLAVASGGCSARVEVAGERSAAVQTESESVGAPPVVAVEKSRTKVEIDVLEQLQPEPILPPMAPEQRATTPRSVPVNTDGIQLNGNENTVEFHFHCRRRSRSPVLIYPIVRHEMIIVPGDGSAPVVFKDNAPPRIALVDKEVARAYAAHMLRLARREGHR